MRLLVLVLAAGCWRGAPPAAPVAKPADPPSFVARVTGLAELQRETASLEPRLDAALRRIFALATEAERSVIRDDLEDLASEVAQLSARTRGARTRGTDAAELAVIQRKLADAGETLLKLRDGLHHATSLERLQAIAKQPTERRLPIDDAFLPTDRVDLVYSPAQAPSRWYHEHFDRP
jgi:hypothetical protein